MCDITSRVSDFVKEKGFRISVLADKTGISKDALYHSLGGKRKLRVDEYLTLCRFLGVAPEYFFVNSEEINSDKAS